MKYLTKEWYETFQWSHAAPKVDDRAAAFSEEFFQEIYQRELADWLKMQFEGAAIDFYVQRHPRPDVLDHAAFERYSREMKVWMETLDPEICDFLNAEKEKAHFGCGFEQKVEALRECLPPEIMAKVADLRVLALGVGTQELRDFFKGRCKWTMEVSDTAWKAKQAYIERHPVSFAKNFYLHDARLVEMRWDGRDMLWCMKSVPGFIMEDRWVRFCNCEVVQMDELPKGAWWLYEEFYEAGDKCEMHVLLVGEDEDGTQIIPLEMILRVEDVRIESA